MSNITDLTGRLDAVRKELATAFEEAGPDMEMDKVKSVEGDSAAKAAWFKQKNDELTDLSKDIEEAKGLSDLKARTAALGEVEQHPGFSTTSKKENEAAEEQQHKSIGDLFIESEAAKQKGAETFIKDVNLKTLFETGGGSIAYTGATAGWYPMDQRTNTLVDYYLGRRPLLVSDIIPKSTTNAAAITYAQEESFTNAAVEVTEGSAKPEAALDVSMVTEAVRKIAVWIPVTDEQLMDVSQVRDYLNNRLGFMVRARLDQQILTGNGTAPNLKGILNRSSIQTQAKGTDPTPDAIYKAITKVRVNDFSEPNAVVMHPNDWQDVRLLRTSDGIYIWGSPADAGPERIWGLQVIQTTAETENTALVGDFNQAELAMRQGLTFKVTDSHASYFVSNIQVVLAELRAALLVYREAAFCKVTGI